MISQTIGLMISARNNSSISGLRNIVNASNMDTPMNENLMAPIVRVVP
jgi:hypothetical protein